MEAELVVRGGRAGSSIRAGEREEDDHNNREEEDA
jgi:hypothetical protein